MTSALLDRTGRELAAGDLVTVRGTKGGEISGRVNHVFESTVFVEGQPYLAHDITRRVEQVELMGEGAVDDG